MKETNKYNGCYVNVTNVLTQTVANSKRTFHFIKIRFHYDTTHTSTLYVLYACDIHKYIQ